MTVRTYSAIRTPEDKKGSQKMDQCKVSGLKFWTFWSDMTASSFTANKLRSSFVPLFVARWFMLTYLHPHQKLLREEQWRLWDHCCSP